MIVIVDGPEKAGKTTLIEKVIASLPDEVSRIHRRWEPVSSWDEYVGPITEDHSRPHCLAIWDRSWASEVVYNELLDRGRNISELAILSSIERPIIARSGLLLMVTAPVHVLEERRKAWTGKPDLPVSPEEEVRRFKKYAREHGWSTLEASADESAEWLRGAITPWLRSLRLSGE